MKIVLCDDHEFIAPQLETLIQKFDKVKQLHPDFLYFPKPSVLFEYLQTQSVDLIFMDLDFCDETEDGIVWLKKIKKQFPNIVIIILTSYENRYKEGYEVRAFRFMTKPIDENELFDYLSITMEELELTQSIPITRHGVTYSIMLQDICYLCAQSGGSEIWTRNSLFCCEESLVYWEKQLPTTTFFRCHSKYIINLSYVSKYEQQTLTLINGKKIPVSRRKWKAFQLAYMKFDTRNYRL